MTRQVSAPVVYIVDDDDSVRTAFARLLRSAGFEPRPYESAERFLEEVQEIPGACILLDITIPRMSGPQVQQSLNDAGSRLPVITISARDDIEARTRARELGAKLFLRKPVDDQALLDAIDWVTASPGPFR